ncbi:hypothetical protein QYE76_029823 [Lolium multiflorum]|uniref:phosphopyruvate hydratase n=1 Tax=Lolium multiflorum TaxID=4521 RepID=A0AAD8QNI4_LOLMU|nr:hypothetical protein QYE76_029823 [Lolium multiflorum]
MIDPWRSTLGSGGVRTPSLWFPFFVLQISKNNDGSQNISGDSLKNVYKSFADEYPIFPIEDPFDHDDWVHYAKMTEEIGEQVLWHGKPVHLVEDCETHETRPWYPRMAWVSCGRSVSPNQKVYISGCFDEIKFFASSTSSTLAAGGCHPTPESVLAQH